MNREQLVNLRSMTFAIGLGRVASAGSLSSRKSRLVRSVACATVLAATGFLSASCTGSSAPAREADPGSKLQLPTSPEVQPAQQPKASPEPSAPVRPPAVLGSPGEQMFQEGALDDRCEQDSDCSFYLPPMVGCGVQQCAPKAGTRAGALRAEEAMRQFLEKAKCNSAQPPDPDACGHVGSYRCHCREGKPPALRCEANVCRFEPASTSRSRGSR